MRTMLLLAVAAVALIAATVAGTPVPDELRGQVSAVGVEADPHNALRGEVTVTSREPTTVEVEVASPQHGLRITETTPPATEHSVPLLELRAEQDYDVSLTVRDDRGEVVGTGSLGRFTTGELPADLPPVRIDVATPQAMAPGLTLFNSVYRDPPSGPENPDVGFLTAVDADGNIVWYERDRLSFGDARRLDDGDLLHASSETGARRITPTGETVAEWRGSSPGTDPSGIGEGLGPGETFFLDVATIHHEVDELPDGNLVGLGQEVRTVELDDPCDESDDIVPTDIVGDVIVVWDPATGEILAEHSLFDVLDPADDADDDLCNGLFAGDFPDADVRDWSHGNAVVSMDDGATWLVSFRHLDELIAFRAVDEADGPAGSIRWRMGPGDDTDFVLEGAGRWFWHQHAPEVEPDGSLMVYDNGNGRTDADASYSRAVRYEFDADAGTVRQVWEHRMPDDVFASFLGDADVLDGTVLVTHGGQTADCPLAGVDDTYFHGQIVEVDEDSGDIVWQLTTRDADACTGWAIYRAERVPTLYPPEYEATPLTG